MRVLTILSASVLSIASLAGCLSTAEDGVEAGADDGQAAGDNETSNQTGQAPIAVIIVSSNGTELVAENGSFAAEAEANLTFDGTGSADPEGTNLTFAWDFGDGNASTESNATHAFAAEGTYNVSLIVTDEENLTGNQTIAIVVAPGGPASGTVLRVEKKTFTGTITVGVQATACGAGVGAAPTHTWEVPATDAESGAPILVTKWLIKTSGSQTNVDTDYQLVDPSGKILGQGTGSSNVETIEVEGKFPPGKYTIKVFACVAVQGTYTINAEATIAVA